MSHILFLILSLPILEYRVICHSVFCTLEAGQAGGQAGGQRGGLSEDKGLVKEVTEKLYGRV